MTANRIKSWLGPGLAHTVVLLILGYAYSNYVTLLFTYQGFEPNFSFVRLAISVLLLVIILLFLPNKKPIALCFSHLAVIVIVTPSLVLFYAGGESERFILVTCLCFLTICLSSRIPLHKLPEGIISSQSMAVYATLGTAFTLVVVIISSGLTTPNFDLTEVYEIREDISDNGSAFSYIEMLGSKAILPMAVALACFYRQRVIVASLIVMAVLLFGFTTHKSMALYPFLAIGIYFVMGERGRISLLVWGVAALILMSILDMWLYMNHLPSTNTWILSLITRRTLLVPSQLNADYLDTFYNLHRYYWSSSRITFGLIDPPYSLQPPELVAETLTGRIFSANAGWIGSGYAQAGLLGALLYSTLLGLVFSFFDRCAQRGNPRVVAAAAVVPVFAAVTATDFLTALLSHGLALTMLMLFLIAPAEQNYRMLSS